MANARSLSVTRVVCFLAAPALVVAAFVGSSACSSTAKLVGSGQACQLASDCEEGLICIPSGTGRVCSSNLASIQKTESTPPTDAASDAPPNVYDAPDDLEDAAPVTMPMPTPDSATSPPTPSPDAATDGATPVKDAARD